MERRVSIKWTTTAKEALRKLPQKVRRGLLTKADELSECDDPRKHCKALKGLLKGYYRIVYSRYRAIFSVEDEQLTGDDVILHVTIQFVAAGQRKEHDRNDVYRVAEKLARMVLKDGETLDSVSVIKKN